MDEDKKENWTQTPLGGFICGVLLFGVVAIFVMIYPPSDYNKDEPK